MKEYIVAVPEHLAGDLFKGDPLLIRCKDCKFSVKDENNIFHGSELSKRCIAMGAIVSPDDYCSWAERKEE